jgi:hypothetical protein
MQTFNNFFTEFILPECFEEPKALKDTLSKVWNTKYLDLHDEQGECNVYDAFKEVLETFGMPNDATGHKRYVYMAWAIALAASFTIEAWFPQDERPKILLEQVRLWLQNSGEVVANLADTQFSDYSEHGTHTAAGEAYVVFYRFLKTLDKTKTYQNLLWMLDDAFTGEALTLQYLEKREFFNWWLIDVTPSAYHLKFPTYICTAGGIVSLDSIYLID